MKNLLTGNNSESDFWSISENFIYRHHVMDREKVFVPRDDAFPILLTYIDVVQHTRTNLDVLQESKLDENWNVEGETQLSRSWKGFTRCTFLDERSTSRHRWAGRRSQRPDLIIIGQRFGQTCRFLNGKKAEAGKEKNRPNAARQWRGLYNIDRKDQEFDAIIKNSR